MKYILGFTFLLLSVTVYAACTTTTVMTGQGITVCTTCCDDNGNCRITCV
jgi:hypothetical protein